MTEGLSDHCRHWQAAKGLATAACPDEPASGEPDGRGVEAWVQRRRDLYLIKNGAVRIRDEGDETKLSDKDIWNVVNYIRSLGPNPDPIGVPRVSHSSALLPSLLHGHSCPGGCELQAV